MIIVITSIVVQGLTFQISHPDWLLETNQMENKGHAKEECEDRFDPGTLEAEGQSKMIACRRPKWMMFGKLFWNLDPN
jgi:hypothetical protein